MNLSFNCVKKSGAIACRCWFDGEMRQQNIVQNKPQINADELRFVNSLASLLDHIASPYALCAAWLYVLRMGEVRRGGGKWWNFLRYIVLILAN